LQLTTIILTYNEEQNLPACLESIKKLESQLFIVDSGSVDRTIAIARAAGAYVVTRSFDNYAEQRNWAQENLPIQSEWVLHLDADERLTPELVDEIKEKLGTAGSMEPGARKEEHGAGSLELGARYTEHGAGSTELGVRSEEQGARRTKPGAGSLELGAGKTEYGVWSTIAEVKDQDSDIEEIDGYLLRKRTFFMDRWIRHGGHYPSYHLRLFRKSKGFCEQRLYDQHFIVKGNVAKLNHDYLDVLSSDLNRWSQRHIRWATLEAKQSFMTTDTSAQVVPTLFGSPIERRRWLKNKLYNRSPLLWRPLVYWIYRYFIRLGFLDGKEGFVFHFLQGFWFRLLVDIKIDELRKNQRSEIRGQHSEIRHQPSDAEPSF
jgi:glycosyltransferase involved in cell wall biosynthesis